MNLRNDLRLIAVEVNNLLARYIKIHDAVFKFSWRKIIPLPLIFKAIDFSNLHRQAERIVSELETCSERIDRLIGATTEKESRFAHCLSEYCMALTETVSLLKDILHQLYLKSENSNQYSFSEYSKQCELYKRAVDEYSRVGSALNELLSEFDR